jgi:hypothetical protein
MQGRAKSRPSTSHNDITLHLLDAAHVPFALHLVIIQGLSSCQ